MTDKQGNQKIKNIVHDDEIWKQTVKFEKDTAQQWKNHWGFMTDTLYGKNIKKKQNCFFPEINNTSSVFPVRKNRKRPEIIKDFLLTYQIDKAMTYESPIKNYTYPYSTNTEIGWPWCDDSFDRFSSPSNQNKIFDYLPKCQCKDINLLSINSTNNNKDNNNSNIASENSASCTSNIDDDDSFNSQNFLKTKKLIDIIQNHGSGQYRLKNPMRWWGGCIESLP
ncbi:hypothetical protein BCR32DRAFT_267423 [Anaeromyces robustus]|uniref:Uncharacterized protein n=1 Tax=Anaeromyces robustus TaxID=1754192 RepID=A0A1Y1XAK2_9FUNG|nr:hypothetical protein BCR32DRAFT_267423 [Anaeromyces robustus]|eukprot:ORX82782.1 hypothetical protein BCR32DRAFT_267423 [Anaeromyces robustus]